MMSREEKRARSGPDVALMSPTAWFPFNSSLTARLVPGCRGSCLRLVLSSTGLIFNWSYLRLVLSSTSLIFYWPYYAYLVRGVWQNPSAGISSTNSSSTRCVLGLVFVLDYVDAVGCCCWCCCCVVFQPSQCFAWFQTWYGATVFMFLNLG